MLRERGKYNKAAAYVLFPNVPPRIVKNSEYRPGIVGGKPARIYYDESQRCLIVKVPSGDHEIAGVQLNREFCEAFLLMGLTTDILGMGKTKITEGPYS